MSIHVWLDLETTGLDEKDCSIIEVATIITGDDWNPLDEYQAVINPGNPDSLYYDEAALGFHKKSGLYNEVKNGISLGEAEADVLALIKKHEPNKRRAKLAGNSIHFDRRFMLKYMPSIVSHLSSRHLDVSSIGVWMDAEFGKDKAEFKAHRPHRALDDLHRSIKQLKFYKESFLKTI